MKLTILKRELGRARSLSTAPTRVEFSAGSYSSTRVLASLSVHHRKRFFTVPLTNEERSRGSLWRAEKG